MNLQNAGGAGGDYRRFSTTRRFAVWRDRTSAELWIIGQLLCNLPGDINTDYRHIAKPWPLYAIFMDDKP
jgi:hypothetical protein